MWPRTGLIPLFFSRNVCPDWVSAGILICALPSSVGISYHVVIAQQYCQRVIALRDGELVFDGPTAALTPAFLRDLYGSAVDELLDSEPLRAVAAPAPDFRHLKLAAAA